jgi:hypothetical protein
MISGHGVRTTPATGVPTALLKPMQTLHCSPNPVVKWKTGNDSQSVKYILYCIVGNTRMKSDSTTVGRGENKWE